MTQIAHASRRSASRYGTSLRRGEKCTPGRRAKAVVGSTQVGPLVELRFIHPIIFDEMGNEIPVRSGRAGKICIQNPWPGSFQTIWKDPDRYIPQYYARYCKNRNSRDWRDWPYMAGDGALQAADGYYRILGRIDDVINVAGHRLGTKEIESASLLVEEVAEAAVIPARDEIKGRVPDLYVSLKPARQPSEDIRKRVEDTVGLGKKDQVGS